MRSGEERLREAVRRLGHGPPVAARPLDQAPGCAYGMLTGRRVEDLARSLEELKGELRWSRRWLVATFLAVVAEALLGRLGLG